MDPRTILHVDMDAFFASVEQRDDPRLRNRPVLVGGRSARGVVSAASYEARAFGCRSAMPTAQALQLCPHAVVVKGRFDAYRAASRAAFDVFARYTPQIQPLSIDEAWLDVTGSARLHGDGPAVAAKIRRDVLADTRLTCSVGVAPNKFLAKLASGMNKPDGLTVITHADVDRILSPLPIGDIWGIGPATVKRLARFGVRTVADLRGMPDGFFADKTAGVGEGVRRLIHGFDDRPVVGDRVAKSIGHEHTFDEDVAGLDELRRVLLGQVEHVAARLRNAGSVCRGVTVKLRHGGNYAQFVTLTRAATMPAPTDATLDLWRAADALLTQWAENDLRPLRLLGVSLGDLRPGGEAESPGLFPDVSAARQRRLDATVDAIAAKLGRGSVRRGLALPEPP